MDGYMFGHQFAARMDRCNDHLLCMCYYTLATCFSLESSMSSLTSRLYDGVHSFPFSCYTVMVRVWAGVKIIIYVSLIQLCRLISLEYVTYSLISGFYNGACSTVSIFHVAKEGGRVRMDVCWYNISLDSIVWTTMMLWMVWCLTFSIGIVCY